MIPDISALFDSSVAISAGFVSEETVSKLLPLGEHDTPDGYARWAEKRKREFRAGRHHAKRALEELGVHGFSIARDADGVPRFPEELSGSITHTGRKTIFAAAAVGPGKVNIGIDAETIATWSSSLEDRILSPQESAELRRLERRLPPHLHGQEHIGVLAFSAKEAFYKCVFPAVRSYIDFHEVDFRLDDEPGCFIIETHRPDLKGLPRKLLGRYICDESYVICGVSWFTEAPAHSLRS